jgi:hypothetical protein
MGIARAWTSLAQAQGILALPAQPCAAPPSDGAFPTDQSAGATATAGPAPGAAPTAAPPGPLPSPGPPQRRGLDASGVSLAWLEHVSRTLRATEAGCAGGAGAGSGSFLPPALEALEGSPLDLLSSTDIADALLSTRETMSPRGSPLTVLEGPGQGAQGLVATGDVVAKVLRPAVSRAAGRQGR